MLRITTKDNVQSIKLFCNPLDFPFDHYYTNIFLLVPITNILSIESRPNFAEPVYENWIPYNSSNSDINQTYINQTFLQSNVPSPFCFVNSVAIKKDVRTLFDALCGNGGIYRTISIGLAFDRNDYIKYTILVPLLATFYLLGAIFIVTNTSNDQLTIRLTITFAVFAFLFTFTSVVNQYKPAVVRNSLTVADSLMTLIILSTIFFTISSVIGRRYSGIVISVNLRSKYVSRLRLFSNPQYEVNVSALMDVMAFFIVTAILLWRFFTLTYPNEIIELLAPIILLGMGYGLLVRFISSQQRKRQ